MKKDSQPTFILNETGRSESNIKISLIKNRSPLKVHLVLFDDGSGTGRIESGYLDFMRARREAVQGNGVDPETGEEFYGPYSVISVDVW